MKDLSGLILSKRFSSLILPLFFGILAFFLNQGTPLHIDTLWFLTGATQIIKSSVNFPDIYLDLIDPHPITFWFLMTVPAFLSSLLSTEIVLTCLFFICCLISLSLFIAGKLINLISKDLLFNLIMIFVSGIVLSVIIHTSFSEREHLMIIFGLPYIFMSIARALDIHTNKTLQFTSGFMAFVGFTIKPHFLAIPIILEIYLTLKKRRFVFCIENTMLLCLCLSLFSFMWFFTPLYFSETIPFLTIYWQSPGLELLKKNMMNSNLFLALYLSIPFILFFYLKKTLIAKETIKVLLISVIGGFFIPYMQGEFHTYHFYPIYYFYILSLSLISYFLIKNLLDLEKFHFTNKVFIFFMFLFTSLLASMESFSENSWKFLYLLIIAAAIYGVTRHIRSNSIKFFLFCIFTFHVLDITFYKDFIFEFDREKRVSFYLFVLTYAVTSFFLLKKIFPSILKNKLIVISALSIPLFSFLGSFLNLDFYWLISYFMLLSAFIILAIKDIKNLPSIFIFLLLFSFHSIKLISYYKTTLWTDASGNLIFYNYFYILMVALVSYTLIRILIDIMPKYNFKKYTVSIFLLSSLPLNLSPVIKEVKYEYSYKKGHFEGRGLRNRKILQKFYDEDRHKFVFFISGYIGGSYLFLPGTNLQHTAFLVQIITSQYLKKLEDKKESFQKKERFKEFINMKIDRGFKRRPPDLIVLVESEELNIFMKEFDFQKKLLDYKLLYTDNKFISIYEKKGDAP